MGSNTTRLNFFLPDDGEVGWGDDKRADWSDLDGRAVKAIADGTIVASGGASPAVDTLITGVSADQLAEISDVAVWVDADPAFSADYAFNYDWEHHWDDSDGEIDVNITVNWDTDPGASNDVTLHYAVFERGLGL